VIGYQATSSGGGNTGNTVVGATASISSTGSNNTALGFGASITGTTGNLFRLGNTSVAILQCQVALTVTSDGRIKNNITENIKGIDFIKLLRPISYNTSVKRMEEITGTATPEFDCKYDGDNVIKNGFIAQEVRAAAIESEYNSFSGVDEGSENSLWHLRTTDLIPSIVKSIQELESVNNKLQSENNDLKYQIEYLKSENENVKSRLTLLEEKLINLLNK